MEGSFGFALIVLITLSVVYRLYKFNKLKKEAMEAMPDSEHTMDEVQEEDYNGQDLYIRDDEREVWNKLSRKQKRWLLNEQKKAIKSGRFIQTPDGKYITRAEARKHGLI